MKGHIRPRGTDGKTWAIVIDHGKDADGKRRQKWHTVHGGKRDAQRELARLLNELNTGSYVEPAKMNVAQYLEKWLADYAKPNVAPKTYETYAVFVKVHLAPALGHHPLSKLTPLHIQSFYTKAQESGRANGQGGLSARSVLHLHRVLREALNQAVKWQLLARNPADAVEPPRAQHAERPVLDTNGIRQILAAARDSWLYLPILLAVTTGMRRGEVLGLRWEDVDLKAGTAAVRQSLESTRENGLAFKAPKTQKSRRVVALPEVIVEELRRQKARQAEKRLLLGPDWQNNGLVVAQDDGSPRTPDNLTHGFLKLVRRAGLPAVTFHDLRHTHATHLLQEGVHPKVVSERLGHSTVGITLDTYSHVLPGMQAEAARRVDAVMRAVMDEDEQGNQRRNVG